MGKIKKGIFMKYKIQWLRIITLTAIIMSLMVSCYINFAGGGGSGSGKTRQLGGIEYTIISPQDYAKKIKAGEIGINEMYVIDGLVMGTNDNNLMIQKAGLTNLFSSDEPIDLNMGTRIRVYFETSIVNTVLLSASQATIIKLEKL